jgi:hypothetical protein
VLADLHLHFLQVLPDHLVLQVVLQVLQVLQSAEVLQAHREVEDRNRDMLYVIMYNWVPSNFKLKFFTNEKDKFNNISFRDFSEYIFTKC